MKRPFVVVLIAVAAAVAFAALVYAVLMVADLSEPATTTVSGLTSRRLWATTAAVLAIVGVAIGGQALASPVSRFGTASRPRGALAVAVGLIAALSGGLNLAVANGGPGTGNGVVGGAAAFVLGLAAAALGWIALVRSRRTALQARRIT